MERTFFVVGPFTKETEDPFFWLDRELSRISASQRDVDAKAACIFLPDERLYRLRIEERGSAWDEWKLQNWDDFSRSLALREIKWNLPLSSILYFDNSGPLSEEKNFAARAIRLW